MSQSLSARRSPPRTRSKSLLEPDSSLHTRSKPLPEPNSSPRTSSKPLPEPNSSPRTRSKPLPEPNSSPRTSTKPLPEPNYSSRTRAKPLPEPNSSPRTRSKPLPKPNSSPQTRSKPLPEPNSSPRTRSKPLPEPNSSPRTRFRSSLKPNSSPGTDGLFKTPYSLGALTPIGTLKTVSLSDWWLTKKGKEKALSITGFESKNGTEVRLFSSGAISKRHDSTTLEAMDGITICISGFINRSQTLENGISNEVCDHFRLGFPHNWKDYNGEKEEIEKNVHTDFSISFDDIPVNRFQDLSFLEGSLKKKMLVDVVDSLRDMVCPKADKECKKSRIDVDETSVSMVVGVKTRGMLKQKEANEASIGKIVPRMSKKKKR